MIILFFLLFIQNAVAEPISKESPSHDVKTVITSDTIECFAKDNVCHAIGNAKAVRTKGKQISTLTATKLSAHFKSKSADSAVAAVEVNNKEDSQKIERLEASENVKLVFGEKIVKADRGVYIQSKGKIYMYGNVSATEKTAKQGRHLQGEYAVIDVKSEHYQVFPQAPGKRPKGQVKILILEEGQARGKKRKKAA